jgi:hypothetical protein
VLFIGHLQQSKHSAPVGSGLTDTPAALSDLQGSNNWQALQKLLVRCVLPALGAQQGSQQQLGIVPGGGVRDLAGAPLAAGQVGRQLLALCLF